MLWYKAWIDTRWRFFLGLVLLAVLACATIMTFETVRRLAESLPSGPFTGGEALERRIQESLEAVRTFRGYAWSQWFAKNFPSLLIIAAALLGSGSPLARSGSGVLFSLALPVARQRWIATRAGIGLAELFALALVPSIAISALAPLVGQEFPLGDALVYGLCAFVVASPFFALAVWLSTFFSDVWRPLLLTCLAALALAGVGLLLPESRGLFQAMAGHSYFFTGSLSWPELVLSVAGAGALIHSAGTNVARRDF